MSQTVWPLNENSEVVFNAGTGSGNVTGYLSQDVLPSKPDGSVPVVFGGMDTSLVNSLKRSALVGSELSVMASPPTVTAGTNGGSSQIASSVLVSWSDPRFSYTGKMVLAASTYPDYFYGQNKSVSYSPTSSECNFLNIDFCTDAAVFEISVKGTGGNSGMKILVDGQLVSDTEISYPANGGLYLTKVDFGTKKPRRIRLFCKNPHFGGIRVSPVDTVWSSPAQPIRCMFVGDSFTEGAAGQLAFSSYAPLAAAQLGWGDTWISGVGSTGYLAAPSPKLTFRQRLDTDIVQFSPDVLVIAGGINDTAFSDAQIEEEANKLFNEIRAKLPNTPVFVLGPWNPRNAIRPGLNTALKNATSGRPNFYFVPNYDDAWITGTGTAVAPTGSGNSDVVISSDNTHPTPYGITYLARRVADSIKTIINNM